MLFQLPRRTREKKRPVPRRFPRRKGEPERQAAPVSKIGAGAGEKRQRPRMTAGLYLAWNPARRPQKDIPEE